jgi:hypothetical protein
MGIDVHPRDLDPGVSIIDWGEALPVIFGNYEDEPDHNFTLFKAAPTLLGGSITSLPPEVFSPWENNADFGGLYETWGMGILLHHLILFEETPRVESLGHYVENIRSGRLEEWVNQQVEKITAKNISGGSIVPRLFKKMLEISPKLRFSLADVGRVLWDLRFEKLTISDEITLRRYFSNPRDYVPPSGWKYSYFPDYD